MKRSEEEFKQIELHKYFLSEKQGHDVGWEFAEKDWEQKFGDDFRRQHGSLANAGCCTATAAEAPSASSAACCQTVAATPHVAQVEELNGTRTDDSAVLRQDPPGRRHDVGPLRRLFALLFQQQSTH